MPVKTKAKDHSEYMKHISHINMYKHDSPRPKHTNTGKKILVALGVILIIVLIFISLVVQV